MELEEGDVVGGALDAGHDAGFVVEFDTGRPHVVADAGTLDTGGKIIAELVLVGLGELAPEEGGDIIGLNGVYGGADNGLVERLKLGLFLENDIGGEFHLHEAPVVAGAEAPLQWAETVWPID